MKERKEVNEILGKRLRAGRESSGYTREAFAEKIGVSARFLADVEAGAVGVSLTTLKTCCLVLGLSADDLLGLSEENLADRQRRLLCRIVQNLDEKHLPAVQTLLSYLSTI